jgi:hypothetical protein
MNGPENLKTRQSPVQNRLTELEERLRTAERHLKGFRERLTLSEQDRAILQGHGDGCIRVGEMWPIVALSSAP